jgi:hypothetical protein
MYWPGEVAEGNGTEQAIVDERADPPQRERLRKILHGEATAPHVIVHQREITISLSAAFRATAT